TDRAWPSRRSSRRACASRHLRGDPGWLGSSTSGGSASHPRPWRCAAESAPERRPWPKGRAQLRESWFVRPFGNHTKQFGRITNIFSIAIGVKATTASLAPLFLKEGGELCEVEDSPPARGGVDTNGTEMVGMRPRA